MGQRIGKPKLKPKVVVPLEMSQETAANVQANPQDVKVASKDADGITHLEKVVVVGTLRDLQREKPKGYVMGKPEYYQREIEALIEVKNASGAAGGDELVAREYDPFSKL